MKSSSGRCCPRLVLMCLIGWTSSLTGQEPRQDVQSAFFAALEAQQDGRLETAVEGYRATLRLDPSLAEAHRNLGLVLHLQQKWQESLDALSKAISLKPGISGANLYAGLDHLKLGQPARATAFLRKAVQQEPGNKEARAALAKSLWDSGQIPSAIAALEQSRITLPRDEDIAFLLGEAYRKAANLEFDTIQQQAPGSAWVNLILAENHAAQGHTDEAISAYRKLLKQDPGWPGAHLELSRLLEKQGMQREAQEERRAGDVTPAAVRTGWRDWFSRGAYERVIVEARTALRSDPANPEPRYWLGRSYQVLALRTLERLVESDPESYRAHQLFAQGLASQGEKEKALAEYRAVEKRKPGLPGLHFAMGELLWMLNREDAAAEEFASELSLNARHAEAGAALGTVLVSRYKPDQAVPVLERALKLNPGLSEARRELGRAYYQLQQYEKAEVQLRQVLERDGDGSTHYLLGRVYRELGRMEDAERVLNKAAELKARSGPPPMKEP